MKKGIIIQASSRSIGNTSKVVAYYSELTGFDVIDLNKKDIKHFEHIVFSLKDKIRKMKEIKGQRKNLQKEYDKLMPEICPLCGK